MLLRLKLAPFFGTDPYFRAAEGWGSTLMKREKQSSLVQYVTCRFSISC